MTFAIIGYGTVGQATRAAAEFHGHECCFVIDEKGGRPVVISVEGRSLADADFAFVCVDTPSRDNGSCDIDNVCLAFGSLLGRGFTGGVVVRSTIPPGTCANSLTEVAFETAGALCGGINPQCLLYNPEFLRVRDIEHTSRWPSHVVIGMSSAKGGPQWQTNPWARKLRDFYRPYFDDVVDPPIIGCSWETAEFYKYASNALLALVITGAEVLSDVAEAVDADWQTCYSIAQHCYATPKTIRVDPQERGFGGPCLPKDLSALLSFSEKAVGRRPPLFEWVNLLNEELRANADTKCKDIPAPRSDG